MAHWHALAKLRVHTDLTLNIMDGVTADLGSKLRTFQKETCEAFPTRELKRERDARIHRAQQTKATPSGAPANKPVPRPSGSSSGAPASNWVASSRRGTDPPPLSTAHPAQTTLNHNDISKSTAHDSTKHKKTFNLQTYKLHALGDYTTTIRKYGTTDSYSTEMVCMAHCRLMSHSL